MSVQTISNFCYNNHRQRWMHFRYINWKSYHANVVIRVVSTSNYHRAPMSKDTFNAIDLQCKRTRSILRRNDIGRSVVSVMKPKSVRMFTDRPNLSWERHETTTNDVPMVSVVVDGYSYNGTFQEQLQHSNPLSNQEWEQIYADLSSKMNYHISNHQNTAMDGVNESSISIADIVSGANCIRLYCVVQCRQNLSKLNHGKKPKFNEPNKYQKNDNAEFGIDAAKAITLGLDLFGLMVKIIDIYPHLIQVSKVDQYQMKFEDDRLVHWYDGQMPRATHLLNAILDAYRLCWIQIDDNAKYLPTPESILHLLQDNWSIYVPMNERTYTVVMDALVATMHPHRCAVPLYYVPLLCEKILDHMMLCKLPGEIPGYPRQYPIGISTMPDNITYSTALNAWARCRRPDAADRAEKLFFQLTKLCDTGILQTTPNQFCCNSALIAMTEAPNSILRIRPKLLERSSIMKRNKHTENMIENVLARETVLLRAEQMFRYLQKCHYPKVTADTISFRNIIFAWADYSLHVRHVDRVKCTEAINRAITLLYEMVQLHIDSNNTRLDVDSTYYGKIISSLAMNQSYPLDENAFADLRRAEDVYHHLLHAHHRTQHKRFKPDDALLRAMVIVYSKDKRPGEADTMLSRLEQDASRLNDPSLLPRPSHYFDTLHSWIQLVTDDVKFENFESAREGATKAQELLLRVIDLAPTLNSNNVRAYDHIMVNNIFELWILCREPQRAENFFRIMEEIYKESRNHEWNMNPSQFRRLLTAWTTELNDATIDTAQHAEKLLNEMQQRFETSGMKEYRPTVVAISQVVRAWLRTDHPNLVAKCKGLYDDTVAMYKLEKNDELRPDITLYGSVFRAYARAGDGHGAMEFFSTMLNDYYVQKNPSAQPTTGIFNMILLSWLKSNDPRKEQHAIEVYEKLMSYNKDEKFTIEPDIRTYDILLEILDTPTNTMDDMYNLFVKEREKLEKKHKRVNKKN